jgi:hypothetical protein
VTPLLAKLFNQAKTKYAKEHITKSSLKHKDLNLNGIKLLNTVFSSHVQIYICTEWQIANWTTNLTCLKTALELSRQQCFEPRGDFVAIDLNVSTDVKFGWLSSWRIYILLLQHKT